MKFGLLYEMQRPLTDGAVDEKSLVEEALEQCVLADRVPHEKVMRSIELFGTEVAPKFRG